MSRFPRVFVFYHGVMHRSDDLVHELFAYLICAAGLWNQLHASSQSGVYVRSHATYLFFFWSNFVSYFSRSFFNLYGTGPRIWTLTKEVGAPCATFTLVRYLWWVRLDLNQHCPQAPELQSGGVTNFPTHPLLDIRNWTCTNIATLHGSGLLTELT